MDHGMNGKRTHMQSNKREIEQNIHQKILKMNENHTCGTIILFLQVIVFIDLFVYMLYHVFNLETKLEFFPFWGLNPHC